MNCVLTSPLARAFANGLGDRGSIPGQVIPKTQKWYLISPCLTLGIIRYVSRVKWSNPRKGVVPFPTPRCTSYWKGSFRVTLNYSHQFYYVQIFKTIEESEFCVLIKHCFLTGEKLLFKQSNGLISIIWILFHWKQWLRGVMLTLNTLIQTQMMMNAQVAQIRQLSQKTHKEKSSFIKTMQHVTSWLQQWQNYINCPSDCFRTQPILQIWPPVTTGCLQTSRKCSRERDLAPMKKGYWKLRHILRPKTNHSTKKA